MRFVGFVILATLLIIAASPRLSDAQDSMKMKKRFVMCLQLDEDPPINLDRPRTFPMNLSFERVRKWKDLGARLYTVNGIWIRNRPNVANADLITLFEGLGGITPHESGEKDLLEVSLESHEQSVRNPDAFHQIGFHLLLNPETHNGTWTAKADKTVTSDSEQDPANSTTIMRGVVSSVQCPSR